MRLSPLDEQYERQLLAEFDRVTRAVVLATLLSALAQGTLAGVGYYIAGLKSVFLLTIVTTVLATIPFVGAGAVWFPCVLWLVFIEGRLWPGVALLLYGALVVSLVDNIIKPLVLHGQSSLHPLLALLSVLGGVRALGPIGVLVGPMVVVFLQALLNILNAELKRLDERRHQPPESRPAEMARRESSVPPATAIPAGPAAPVAGDAAAATPARSRKGRRKRG